MGAGYGNQDDAAEAPEPARRGSAGQDRPGPGPGEGGGPGSDLPAAGPHADASLINPDATPGAGTLPDEAGGDADPGGA